MIVVLGSRHDQVAAELVAAWPGAALCAADDLVQPGWCWYLGSGPGQARRWVVGARVVDDSHVSGVFVRRSAVYAEELPGVHPQDRAFVAAEAHALLGAVLGNTAALVANPAQDGAIGEQALRPERCVAEALRLGMKVATRRWCSAGRAPRACKTQTLQVVAGEAFGAASPRLRLAAVELTRALGLLWASVAFDGRGQLLGLSVTQAPGDDARAALGRLLSRGR